MLGHRTEAETDHGGRTELADGTVLVERYQGTVGAALDRPGLSWARGSATYRIQWPPASGSTCAATPRPSRSSSTWRPARRRAPLGPHRRRRIPATSLDRRTTAG